jgi:cytidyltransferase-like protein
MTQVVLSGSFDDIRSDDIRFIEEASKLGSVHVLLWSDAVVESVTDTSPKFPEKERAYLLNGIRFVDHVRLIDRPATNGLPDPIAAQADIWIVREEDDTEAKRKFCKERDIAYHVIPDSGLDGFPVRESEETSPERKKVVVTGCYDWFHSGHLRFFEEASRYGDLYVVVGNDPNVKKLKGEGHPMFPEEERRYIVQSMLYVENAYIASAEGWMDAAPEIAEIQPDIYLVNEDGDKPIKVEFCREHGLEYVVLKRTPKEGLPRRSSTNLRGF